MNVLLATPLSDDATITGTLAKGGNSLQNMQRRDLFRFYRTETTAQINIDLGTAQEIDFISLISHNGQGTVTIKAGTDNTVSDYNSGALDLITGTDVGNNKNVFAASITAQTFRYWRLDISDSGNPDGYFQAGRLYLSKAFIPAVNASYGFKEGYVDRSRKRRTVAGSIIPTIRTPLRRAEWQLDFATEADMYGTARDIDFNRGTSQDLLFIPDMDDSTYFQKRYIYGTMDSIEPIVLPAFDIYRKAYKITEIK